MSLTTFKTMLATASLGLLLGGCGLTQRAMDGGSSLANGIFYQQVNVLHLDFTGRAALNTAAIDMNGLSVPTLVRVYQLRDRQHLDQSDYQSLLSEGDTVLGADLLNARHVVVKPGEGAQLNAPLLPEAQFVAVVGLFRSPDAEKDSWRLVIARDELQPETARVVELADNALHLQPLAKKASWW